MNLLKRITIPVSLIIVSIIFWIQTYRLPSPRYEPLGPSFFPRLLLLSIMGLSITDLFIQLVPKESKDSSKASSGQTYKYLAYSLIAIFLYLIVIYLGMLNFILTTFIFLLAFIWILSPKKLNLIPAVLLISASTVLIIYLMFIKYLWVSFD